MILHYVVLYASSHLFSNVISSCLVVMTMQRADDEGPENNVSSEQMEEEVRRTCNHIPDGLVRCLMILPSHLITIIKLKGAYTILRRK
jgi:hypothetical protein